MELTAVLQMAADLVHQKVVARASSWAAQWDCARDCHEAAAMALWTDKQLGTQSVALLAGM